MLQITYFLIETGDFGGKDLTLFNTQKKQNINALPFKVALMGSIAL
jgi:hypothetical protein